MKKHVWFILYLVCTLVSSALGKETMLYHRYTTQDGLSHRFISMFVQDDEGYIWMGTWNGLCRFDGNRFETFNITSDSTKLGRILGVRVTQEGMLRIQNQNSESFIFNPKTLSLSPCDKNVKIKRVIKPQFYNDVDSFGLLIRRGDSEYRIPFANTSFSSNTRYQSFLDRQGNLWANFDDALIQVSFSPIPFEHFQQIDGKQSPYFNEEVRAYIQMNDSMILCSSKNEYLYLYHSKGNFIGYIDPQGNITSRPSAFGAKIYDFVQDDNQRIWMASRGNGLYCYNPIAKKKKIKHYNANQDVLFQEDNIFKLKVTKHPLLKGNTALWVGTWGGGVSILDVSGDQPKLIAQTTLPIKVRDFLSLSDSLMAVATTHGVYIFDNHLHIHQQIGDIDASALLRSQKGEIFLSSIGGGLYTLSLNHTGQWQLIPKHFSPLSDVILNMVQSANGKIWFISDNSLYSYNPKDQNIKHFDHRFWGENITFSESEPLLAGDSGIWLGTTMGRFYLNLLCQSQYSPPLFFAPNNHDSIDIQWSDSCQIRPIAFDYRLPRNISYTWREITDSTWQQIEDPEHFYLSKLSLGKHIVEIRSTDAYGNWTNNSRKFYITVHLASWQIVFIGSGIILVVSLIGFILYLYLHKSKANNTSSHVSINITPLSDHLSKNDLFIREAKQNVEANIGNSQYGVDEMATALNMSRTVLYIRFKECLNTTPAAFITEIRIKHAEHLLQQGQYNITEVAKKTGFSDVKYFGKVFKKKTGVTPTQYGEATRK